MTDNAVVTTGRTPGVGRIVIGVTIDDSLQFHTGLPAALCADGWDVHVVSGDGRRLRELAQVPGITTHVLPMRRGPSPLQDARALVRWVRLLRRVKPDVTLIGTPKAALLGNLAGALCRVPRRIYNLLGLRVETATGILRAVLLSMERVTARNATEVLAVSPSVRRLAAELDLFPISKAVVLGKGSCNGVDIARFTSLPLNVGNDSLASETGLLEGLPVVGFVGRLTRDKGLPELAEALELLAQRGRAVQLLVVGGVDDDSGQTALRMLAATGQRVIPTGYQEDPSLYYPLMDVFCLPSLREGLPNVVLESMASHTTVVASDATGNVDLVIDGQTGYLIPRRSGPLLAAALERAIDDRKESSRMRERAFRFVADNFAVEQVQADIRAFLRNGPADVHR